MHFIKAALAMSLSAVSISLCAPTCLASNFAQQHPRRAQVIQRDQRINNRINNAAGHLNGQYGQLKAEDRGIYRQEQSDARNNGGYITRGQQGQLNREETDLSKQTYYDNSNNKFVQNHPARAQVLSRDYGLAENINADEGKLGGHYGQLTREDNSIRAQEQHDASIDGGHITGAEQHQLNREENRLKNQIRNDYQ